MKYCQQCQRSYPPAQSFCLEDGAQLALKDLYGFTGRLINQKYEIESLAAVGGMSAVYRAHQIGVERLTAFKILLPNIAINNERLPGLFAREAQLAGRLSHENIATIYDAGQTEDHTAYIVMEWLEGQTLENEMRTREYLSYQRIEFLLHQIAAALDAAHAQNIIHRDLKPSNIMITPRPDGSERVKVFDFGLAKVVTGSVDIQVSHALGTPHYASPEQFRTGEEISTQADIYALGVILYRMITGRFPFDGANVHELIRLHLLETPPPLATFRPQVPVELETLVTRMLAKTPHYRPARASEVAELFEAAVQALPDYAISGALLAPEQAHSPASSSNSNPSSARARRARAGASFPTGSGATAPSAVSNSFPVNSGAAFQISNSSAAALRFPADGIPVPTAPLNATKPLTDSKPTPTPTPTTVTTVTTAGSFANNVAVAGNATASGKMLADVAPAQPAPRAAAWPLSLVSQRRLFIAGAATGLLVLTLAASSFLRGNAMRLTEKDTILLADIANATGEEVFDRTLKQALSIQLAQSPFLNLLGDDKVRETLRFMNRKPEERINRDTGREIAQRLGLKAVIVGQIDKLDQHYSITLEAVNAREGNSVAHTLVEAENKDQVLKALGQSAAELRERLGESLNSIEKFNAPIDQATTSSLEALRAYTQGRELYSLKDNYNEGITQYKRAIELDPNFALAYNGLGVIYMNLGQAELSQENAAKAYKLRDRVSERERLAISSFYHLINGEVDKAIETYQLTVQTYPRQVAPHVNLSVCFNRLGQLEAALAETQAAIKLDPSNGTAYQNSADLLVRLGRYDEARQIISAAQANKLDRLGFHATLFQLGFLNGDGALMQQQLAWTKGKPDEFRAAEWQAQTAAFHGQLREANELYRRASDAAKQKNLTEVAAGILMQNGLRHALAGQTDQARALFNEAIALSRNSFAHFSIGKSAPFGPLLLTLGQALPQAQQFEGEIQRHQPRNTLTQAIWLPVTHAAAELQRQQPAKALELLSPVANYEAGAFFYPAWLRGQAYLQLNRSAEAATEFQKMLAQRGVEPTSMLYPLARLGLARAQAQAGQAAQSRKNYEEFFKLWQAADANLPVLNAAKSEYAALR